MLALIGGIAIVVATAILVGWYGLVTMLSWNWVVPEIFTFIPTLTYMQAIALNIITGWLTSNTAGVKISDMMDESDRRQWALIDSLVRPAIVLLFAWVLHFFI